MNALDNAEHKIVLSSEGFDTIISLKSENKNLKSKVALAFETLEKALNCIKFLQLKVAELEKGAKHVK